MGKIPPIKRFRSEDYPTLPAAFLQNLSSAIEAVVNTLDNFVNFDNVSGQLYERVTISKNTSVTASLPFLLPWTKKYTPVAVFSAGLWVKGSDAKTSIGQLVSLEWDFDSTARQIVIKAINGLTLPSTTIDYQITIIAYCR